LKVVLYYYYHRDCRKKDKKIPIYDGRPAKLIHRRMRQKVVHISKSLNSNKMMFGH